MNTFTFLYVYKDSFTQMKWSIASEVTNVARLGFFVLGR